MVAGFNRSFSLPGSPSPKTRPASHKSYHVRSISLPCRSHPLISQLEDDIRSVDAWHTSKPESESTSWICDGLARLELLHASLNDLINLPQNQDSLRRGSGSEWAERILDDFLRFANVQGCFRSEIVALNEHQSDAQVAIRRNDDCQLVSCTKSMRKCAKELVKLASSLRDVSRAPTSAKFTNGIEEAELACVIREVVSVTASALAAVLWGTAGVSSAATVGKRSWAPLRRLSSLSSKSSFKGVVIEENAMERVEEIVRAVESRNERLFRRLVNTRVSLLNIMTC